MNDNGDRKEQERLKEAQARVSYYLAQRKQAADKTKPARLNLQALTSVAIGRTYGEVKLTEIHQAAEDYAMALGTVKDIDIAILQILEPHEVRFPQACASLRKEIERLDEISNELVDLTVDNFLELEADGIDDLLFDNWPPSSG